MANHRALLRTWQKLERKIIQFSDKFVANKQTLKKYQEINKELEDCKENFYPTWQGFINFCRSYRIEPEYDTLNGLNTNHTFESIGIQTLEQFEQYSKEGKSPSLKINCDWKAQGLPSSFDTDKSTWNNSLKQLIRVYEKWQSNILSHQTNWKNQQQT